MRIRLHETGRIVAPAGASAARPARPAPREQLTREATAVMRGKDHEIAVVGGWHGSEGAGLAVFTDLDPNAVTINIRKAISPLHKAGAREAMVLRNHTQGPGEGAGWPSHADVDCMVRLRLALREAEVDPIDSLILTPSGGVVSIQRLEEDCGYREQIERKFRATLEARLQRLDGERVTQRAIDRSRRTIERSIRRLEALAAGVRCA